MKLTSVAVGYISKNKLAVGSCNCADDRIDCIVDVRCTKDFEWVDKSKDVVIISTRVHFVSCNERWMSLVRIYTANFRLVTSVGYEFVVF